MDDKFTWRAELTFRGTPAQFNKLAELLEEASVTVEIPEWADRINHLAGCFPMPVEKLINKEMLKRITQEMPRIKIKYIRDIAGGIRTPHVHMGDEIVLLDGPRFQKLAGEVAQKLAELRAEQIDDYIQVMDPINRLAPAA